MKTFVVSITLNIKANSSKEAFEIRKNLIDTLYSIPDVDDVYEVDMEELELS